MTIRTKAILAIVIASLFWSTAGITGKILLKYFDPFFLGMLRSIIASLCIIPIFLRQKHIPFTRLFRDVVPIAALSGLNIVFFYSGLQYTTANASAVMYAGAPLIIALISTLILREPITKLKWTGILVGFIGVLSILLLPSFGKGGEIFGTMNGNLLILLGVLCWATYTVGSRYLTNIKKYSALSVTAISLFTSTIVMITANTTLGKQTQYSALWIPSVWLLFVYLGICVTVITYLLFQWAIKHSSTTLASLTHYLQPVFAAYFAWIFLGEKISLEFFLGSMLILLGVFIVTGDKILTHFRLKKQ